MAVLDCGAFVRDGVPLSGIAPDMQTGSDITHARILNRLLEEENKKFHTEIHQPLAMSVLDASQPFILDEFGVDAAAFVDDLRDWLRTNFVAHDRKRAKEIIEGVKAELAREEKEMRDRMVGTLGR